MKTSPHILTFIVTMLTFVSASGTTVDTPAGTTIWGLRSIVAKYVSSGRSIDALTMDEIMKSVDRDAANAAAQGAFAERFEILGARGPTDPVTKGQMIALTANQISEDRRDTVGRYVLWLINGEVSYAWEPEERVKSLMESAHLTLVNKGVWAQPNTKAMSMFHLNTGSKPPPDDNRVQEDQAGRRLTIPKSKNQVVDPQSSSSESPTIKSSDHKQTSKPTSLAQSKVETPTATPWFVWLLVVIGATLGAVWVFMRKSK